MSRSFAFFLQTGLKTYRNIKKSSPYHVFICVLALLPATCSLMPNSKAILINIEIGKMSQPNFTGADKFVFSILMI